MGNEADGFGRLPVAPIEGGILRHMSGADLRVYIAIVSHVRRQADLTCWPSIETLAELTGLSRGTVCRSLNLLDGILIERQRGGGREPGGKGIPTTYELLQNSSAGAALSEKVEAQRKARQHRKAGTVAQALPLRGRNETVAPAHQEQSRRRSPNERREDRSKREGAPSARPAKLFDDNADDPKPFDAGQAIGIFHEAYQEARGAEPDRPDGRTAGRLKRWIKDSGITSEAWRGRVRLAAGLDGRSPPWPFDRPGELTISGVMQHWAKLGDGLKGARHDTKQRPTPGKYAAFG